MIKTFAFKEPQSLKDVDEDCFVLVDNEVEKSVSGVRIVIGEGTTYYANTTFPLEIHSGDDIPYFRYKGWTFMGNKSCIQKHWSIVLFWPTIIDPYGNMVDFGCCVNEPGIYMVCYTSDDPRYYLRCLFREFAYIAENFVTAEHLYLYDNQRNIYNGNNYGNRISYILKHISREMHIDNPRNELKWLDAMIHRCKAMLLSPIAPSIESGPHSIKKVMNRYEGVRAELAVRLGII